LSFIYQRLAMKAALKRLFRDAADMTQRASQDKADDLMRGPRSADVGL